MELVDKNSLRIVHVENDDDFADLTSLFLQHAGFGHPIARCKDGSHALDYLPMIEADRAPHVILLDLDMPGLNGLEVLRWIRQSYCEPDVAVYLLTSSDDSYDLEQAVRAGVTKYFLKNRSFDALIEGLDQLIAIRNHRQLEAIREMKEVMAELALLSEFIDDMVVLADTEGRIDWVNEPFIRTCGYSLEELRGKRPDALLQGPEADRGTIAMLHEAIQSGRPLECRIVNYKKNQAPYLVHLSFGPVFNQGRLDGFLALEKVLSEGNDEAAARPKPAPKTVSKRGEDDMSALSHSPIFSLK
jgi:PAS domain S-box-containing protein